MLNRCGLATGLVWVVVISSAAVAEDAVKTPSDASGSPAREEPLATGQEVIFRRYRRFEETLGKVAESLRKTDPERADLLFRAIGKSNGDRISVQLNELVQLLRDNKQLGDAIDRQADVVTHMHALLDLLLSEDRQKDLKEEQARIKKYIDEVNNIIAKEKANRADTERGAPTDDVAGQQKKIADQAGNLGKQISRDDEARQAKAQDKPAGKPKADDGKSPPGKSGSENPDDKGSPDGKSYPPDKREDAKPADGKSGEGKPAEPKSGEGKPAEGKSGEGKPGEGKSSDGKPSEGQEGQSQEGQSQEGQSQEGQAPPTPGREELERAKRDMERAIDKLKKNQRNAASDAQDDALANLQKAKEKLEEILKQLREEERERFLAMLEARFQQMLAMQIKVYDGTRAIDKTAAADRSGQHSTRALQLARNEEEIAIEATKALTLLRDEGTAIAFPEAVEQMRDDMRIVITRLERTEVGELTQSIEKEIIDALEEMIDALQKEMEKSKDKKKEEQNKENQQQQQDQELVDQLAELKMLRTLQLRINHRTKRLGRMVEGEQAQEPDLLGQLQNLADRQARIQKATYDMATGRNK